MKKITQTFTFIRLTVTSPMKPKSPKTNFKAIFPQISLLSVVLCEEAGSYKQA
jgi:hypothetical protein